MFRRFFSIAKRMNFETVSDLKYLELSSERVQVPGGIEATTLKRACAGAMSRLRPRWLILDALDLDAEQAAKLCSEVLSLKL